METDESSVSQQLSLSTTFLQGGVVGSTIESGSPDVALVSADCVVFYVHSVLLLQQSSNEFNHRIPSQGNASQSASSAPMLPESSEVLNVLLHSLYGLSCERFAPSFACTQQAVECMPTYGLDPQHYVAPSLPLYDLLLSQAAVSPLLVYALAGQYNLASLATAASSHLLSLDLSTISDEVSHKMGTVYLKKLFFLHLGRREVLKQCLVEPPRQHPPNATCQQQDQQNLTAAWIMGASSFVWEGRAGASVVVLESTFNALGSTLRCSECKQALHERIKEVSTRWALVKVFIVASLYDRAR